MKKLGSPSVLLHVRTYVQRHGQIRLSDQSVRQKQTVLQAGHGGCMGLYSYEMWCPSFFVNDVKARQSLHTRISLCMN
jgi:hypothetical protein